MKNIIYKKIGTHLKSVYKLCDYKPTYGYLFEEYIKEYKFWGYCDVDVIFGDLSKFVNEERLKNFDKIYDLGHLSIYRNIKKIREAFMGNEICVVPYKEILEEQEILVFDEPYCLYFDPNNKYENGGINQILIKMGYSVYSEKKDYADLDIKYNNFHLMHTKKDENRLLTFFEYKNGRLLEKSYKDKNYVRERAYVHLQQKKHIKIQNNSKNHFYITPKEFIDTDFISAESFYKVDLKLYWYVKFRAKRVMKHMMYKIRQKRK